MNRSFIHKMKASRIAAGILVSLFLIILLVVTPILISSLVQREGLGITGALSLFETAQTMSLAIIVALSVGASIATRSLPRVSGSLKVIQGAAAALYFYLVLEGGKVSFALALNSFQIEVIATLTLGLLLLELSASLKIIQGLVEIFVDSKTQYTKSSHPTVPPNPGAT